jgi:branched-chain amino acid transport system permease protein
VKIDLSTIVVIGVTIPLLLLMTWIVQSTRQGKAMRATAQDQDAARLMGIDVDRTIAFTFGLGGAMAGAAGVLWVESIGNTRWDAGFRLGLFAFTAAVLGGIGRLDGAVLGGFLIGIVQSVNDSGLLPFGQKWSQTVVFTILILLMVFKPEGILGKPTTEKV